MRKLAHFILAVFLLAPAHASDQVKDVFGLFKDLHGPFLNSQHQELSPINGLDRQLLESLRMHAHQGPKLEIELFERPVSRSIDKESSPLTAFAAFLERVFTSHVGLSPNSDRSDPIHKWLKPRNIGFFFNVITADGFYNWPLPSASLCLAEAFMPDTFDQLLKKAKKQNIKFPVPLNPGTKFVDMLALSPNMNAVEAFLNKQSCLKAPVKFAEFVIEVLGESRGHKAVELGLPPHSLQQVLLTFMWETKTAKKDLLPFYEALSSRLIDKEAVKRIIWEGEGSFYTKQDYWAAKKLKGKLPLEMSRLLRLGYAQFEDRLPPEIYYGLSFVEGLKEPFSDCGETTLRYLLMAFLFDPDKGIFDWTRLVKLREQGIMVMREVIEFFRDFCTQPAVVNAASVRNRWGVIMGLLNHPGAPNIVQMLHPSPQDGKFGINAGIHNILSALGNILNDPMWNRPDDPKKPVQHKLNRVCTLFSPSRLLQGVQAPWEWEFSSIHPSVIAPSTALEPSKRLRDGFNTTVIFKLSGYHVYEWHIQPMHFDFNRANPTYYGADAELASKPFAIPQNMTEEAFPRFLYNSDLRSLRGRLIAINRIYWFKRTFEKSTYDLLLNRWLAPSGKYLGYFGDFASNEILLEILLLNGKSIDEIFDMKVPKLTANLLWMKVRAKDVESTAHLFKRDIELYHAEKKSYHDCDFARMTRIASVAMVKAKKDDLNIMLKAGLEDYFQAVAKRTSLSVALISANQELLESFGQLYLEGEIKLKDDADPRECIGQFLGGLDEQTRLEPLGFFIKHVIALLKDEDMPDSSDLCRMQ